MVSTLIGTVLSNIELYYLVHYLLSSVFKKGGLYFTKHYSNNLLKIKESVKNCTKFTNFHIYCCSVLLVLPIINRREQRSFVCIKSTVSFLIPY